MNVESTFLKKAAKDRLLKAFPVSRTSEAAVPLTRLGSITRPHQQVEGVGPGCGDGRDVGVATGNLH